jgi:hypothetical protein
MSYFRSLQDGYGHANRTDFIGKQFTVDPFRVVGATFAGTTIDTNFWTAANSGTGSSNTQANGLLTMASGTANNGYATLKTARKGRFIFAHPMMWRAALRIPTVVVALNTRRWGAFTDTAAAPVDGFYFELSAAGALSVNCINNSGTPTSVSSGSFNGQVASYTVDTNVHAYEIHYYVMKIEFYVDGTLLHTFTPTTANLSSMYSVPSNFVTLNSASGTTSGTIEVWASNMLRMGPEETKPVSYLNDATTVAAQVLKRGSGQLHHIVVSAVAANAQVQLWDNTAASGTKLWDSGAMAARTDPFVIDLHQVSFDTGLTLTVLTGAATVLIIYE